MPTGLPATDIRRRNPFVPKIGGFGCKTFQGAEAASLVSRLRYSNSVVKKGNTQPPPQSVSYQDFPNGSRRPPESLKRHDKRQQRPQFFSVSHFFPFLSLIIYRSSPLARTVMILRALLIILSASLAQPPAQSATPQALATYDHV